MSESHPCLDVVKQQNVRNESPVASWERNTFQHTHLWHRLYLPGESASAPCQIWSTMLQWWQRCEFYFSIHLFRCAQPYSWSVSSVKGNKCQEKENRTWTVQQDRCITRSYITKKLKSRFLTPKNTGCHRARMQTKSPIDRKAKLRVRPRQTTISIIKPMQHNLTFPDPLYPAPAATPIESPGAGCECKWYAQSAP